MNRGFRTRPGTGRRDRLGRAVSLLILSLTLAACAGGSRQLQLVSGTGAVYPPDARAQGIEGYVVVGYDVDAAGRVRNARVMEASPPDVFDEAAVQAVSRWRFNPPTEQGEPQAVNGLRSRLEFTLDGGDAYDDY